MRKQLSLLPVLVVGLLFFCSISNAQSPNSKIVKVQKADFRGQRPQKATVAAVSASKHKTIVVLLRGADQKLLDEVEGNLKAIIRNGYQRIGLILSDNFPNEENPVLSIYAGGKVYAVLDSPTADSKTSLSVYKLIIDAYQKSIVSAG